MHRRLQLALALASAQQYEEAMEICLGLVLTDKKGVGEDARKLMVDMFNVLPDGSELASTYRRKLSTALY
jgi:putative thioredoxin